MRAAALALLLIGCSEYGVTPAAPEVLPEVDEPEADPPDPIPEHVPTGGVEGTVCAHEFGGLEGAEVSVEHEYGVAKTVTDAQGRFALDELPVGRHVIVVVGPDYRTQIPVDIPAYAVAEVRTDECGDPCDVPVPCVGLAEALDRSAAEIQYNFGSVEITNISEDLQICLTEWIVVLSDTSQDAALGQEPAVRLSPGDMHAFPYAIDVFGGLGDEAWWCVERSQSTATGALYTYNGSLLPDLVYDWVADRTDANRNGSEDHAEYGIDGIISQENIWHTQLDSPIVMVGREHTLVRLTESKPDEVVTVQAWNLGQRSGRASVYEVVPPGFVASNPQPAAQVTALVDGSTQLRWEVELDGAVQFDGLATQYDRVDLTYTLSKGDSTCDGRCEGSGASADWRDTATRPFVSRSEPLVIEVCPPE